MNDCKLKNGVLKQISIVLILNFFEIYGER